MIDGVRGAPSGPRSYLLLHHLSYSVVPLILTPEGAGSGASLLGACSLRRTALPGCSMTESMSLSANHHGRGALKVCRLPMLCHAAVAKRAVLCRVCGLGGASCVMCFRTTTSMERSLARSPAAPTALPEHR